MVGNTVFAVLLRLIAGTDSRKVGQQIAAWLIAALAKFAALYLIVVKVVCGVMAPSLLAAGTLKEPMLKALPATFSWPQLITALIGGGIALLIVPRFARRCIGKSAKFKRGHGLCPRFPHSSNRQTAWQAMPSPVPVKPSFSSVVAFTFTRDGAIPTAWAMFSSICGMKSFSFGR